MIKFAAAAVLLVPLGLAACGSDGDALAAAREACKEAPNPVTPGEDDGGYISPAEMREEAEAFDETAHKAAEAAALDERWTTLAAAWSEYADHITWAAQAIDQWGQIQRWTPEQIVHGQEVADQADGAASTIRSECRVANAS